MIYLLSVSEFYQTDNVSFIYLDLKNKTEVKIDLTKELKEEYINKLLEVVTKIDKEEFVFNTKACPCEFNIICYH